MTPARSTTPAEVMLVWRVTTHAADAIPVLVDNLALGCPTQSRI